MRGRRLAAFWAILGLLAFLQLAGLAEAAGPSEPGDVLAWPEITKTARPWSRWWWLGSAVDRPNLSRLLEEYQEAGFGGVEICPIYGAKGYEDRFLKFLSPEWMEMLAHTTAEARRLDLGVDLTGGTGWPFGGPGVSDEEASSRVVLKSDEVAGGSGLKGRLPQGTVRCLKGISEKGEQVDLTDHVQDGRLNVFPSIPGRWRFYALVQNGPVQQVKRAAPGGEGNVLDPFSVRALNSYLAGFSAAFARTPEARPRAFFHDSFEYYGASWTPRFFEEFRLRRGYDLRAQLPAFCGEGPADEVARVKSDYRETLSDLHLAFIERWTEWCYGQGTLSRNQAHGAPANLIDIYAAADIPETEIFGRGGTRRPLMQTFASSAAHLRGQTLTSAEAFTWLGEHFQVSLAEVKPLADDLFLCGVNHLFYHGIPYSPEDVPWPGWQFYASVNFGPEGGLWRDLPAFNSYVARCQSILQSGRPDQDILLYFPVHDLWHDPEGLVKTFEIAGEWLRNQPIESAARILDERGTSFDTVSDRLLADAGCDGHSITLGGHAYRALILPEVRFLPVATLSKLVELARGGATILVVGSLPDDVPGLGDLKGRQEKFRDLMRDLRLFRYEPGVVRVGADLSELLQHAKVPREPMVEAGLRFVRRHHDRGYHYLLVNRGHRSVDGWIALGTSARSAVLLDPRSADRAGVAALRHDPDGTTRVGLQLQPGESLVLRTFTDEEVEGPPWPYLQPVGEPLALTGTWDVQFIEGGPNLPAGFQTRDLASWTTLGDTEAARFAGTARYTLEFDLPPDAGPDWLLDLGQVRESARVRLNGHDLGTLWCEPYRAPLGDSLRPGRNLLQVEVTNLAANRIADLDRRRIAWKNFHEINFVNREYQPFDASGWPPHASGLLGPVRLIPVERRPAPADSDS